MIELLFIGVLGWWYYSADTEDASKEDGTVDETRPLVNTNDASNEDDSDDETRNLIQAASE